MKIKFKETKSKETTIRQALCAILERDLKNIKNKKILEIGCGSWNFAKKILEKNKCQWYGFEPVDLQEKNLTLVKGSVKNIPYHNNAFDIILCNQTIEHWFEYGVSFKQAFREVQRVLKPNGLFIVNAPIHLHGHPYFLMGKLNRISRLFNKNKFQIVLFEKCFPQQKEKRWRKLSSKGWQSKLGYPDFLIPNSKKSCSYILNIHAVNKKVTLKNKQSAKYAHYIRPIIVILRFIKTYVRTILF